MSNSPLASYTLISPNKNSPRNHKIDPITIHCFVAQVTATLSAATRTSWKSCAAWVPTSARWTVCPPRWSRPCNHSKFEQNQQPAVFCGGLFS